MPTTRSSQRRFGINEGAGPSNEEAGFSRGLQGPSTATPELRAKYFSKSSLHSYRKSKPFTACGRCLSPPCLFIITRVFSGNAVPINHKSAAEAVPPAAATAAPTPAGAAALAPAPAAAVAVAPAAAVALVPAGAAAIPGNQEAAQAQSDRKGAKCSVCMDMTIQARLRCDHVFCIDCLQSLKNLKRPCSICRKPFRKWKRLFGGL